jgi:hypothetical protein
VGAVQLNRAGSRTSPAAPRATPCDSGRE